eukprot:UN24366
MKILLLTTVVVLALSRGGPHRFRAETNHLCDVCTQAVTHLHSTGFKGKDLSGVLDTEFDAIHQICHRDEHADCGGACDRFISDLQNGKFVNIGEKAEKVCELNHWCENDRSNLLSKTTPFQTQEKVDKINQAQSSWKAAVYPRFGNMTRFDFQRFLGTIVDEDLRCNIKHVQSATPGFEAPESFDSKTNWPQCAKVIGDIRDQSNCGCCWAFGASEAASDRMCVATNGTWAFPLSSQQLCFCASYNGCNGGQLYTPWAYIQDNGLVSGGQVNGTGPFGFGMCSDFTLPHCHHHGPQGNDPYPAEGQPGCPSQRSPSCPRRCASTAKDPHDKINDDKYTFDGLISSYDTPAAIQEAIMTDGPVETAFTVYADFANYV